MSTNSSSASTAAAPPWPRSSPCLACPPSTPRPPARCCMLLSQPDRHYGHYGKRRLNRAWCPLSQGVQRLSTAKGSAENADIGAEESPKRGSPSEELPGPTARGRGPELEGATLGITPLPSSDGFMPWPSCRAAKSDARYSATIKERSSS